MVPYQSCNCRFCVWACVSVCPSLYIAVAVGPIGLSHVHAAHWQAHTVDGVTSRRHPLVDPVQTLGLLETADPMLWGEASDGCGDKQARTHTHADTENIDTCMQSLYLTRHLVESCVSKPLGASKETFRTLKRIPNHILFSHEMRMFNFFQSTQLFHFQCFHMSTSARKFQSFDRDCAEGHFWFGLTRFCYIWTTHIRQCSTVVWMLS